MKKLVLLGTAVSLAAVIYSTAAQAQPSTAPITAGTPNISVTQPYTGSFGPDTALPAGAPIPPGGIVVPKALPPEEQALPAAMQPPMLPVTPAEPVVATAPASPPPPVDPCAAYMTSIDAYTFCQDRIKKIERMKETKGRRVDSSKAYYDKIQERRNPTPKAPVVPANKVTEQPAADGIVDKYGKPVDKYGKPIAAPQTEPVETKK